MLKDPFASPFVKKFDKGAVMMREGDDGGEMYIILQGTAAAYQNYQKLEEVKIGSLSQNDFFGEGKLFLNRRSDISVVAQENNVTVMVVNRANSLEILGEQPSIAYSIIEKLCARNDALRQTNEKLLAELKVFKPEKNDAGPSQSSALFPPGHGNYTLELANNNMMNVYEHTSVCPICGQNFQSLYVIASRLRSLGVDRDMRTRYADVEPMHYDIVTCPYCIYSAPSELFPTASKRLAGRLAQEFEPFRNEIYIRTGRDRDTFAVFAGYYLAIRCMYICFDDPHLTIAGMWQKLSRLYKDCKDEEMFLYASGNALKEYDYVYGHANLSDKQMQQVCVIIGDLHERLGNIDMAKTFFFKAKSINNASAAMRLQADRRLEDLRTAK